MSSRCTLFSADARTASIAITYGADIASVSHKLGHAEISTTLNMYTHPDMDSQKKASSIFREALKKAGQG